MCIDQGFPTTSGRHVFKYLHVGRHLWVIERESEILFSSPFVLVEEEGVVSCKTIVTDR